MMRAKGCWLQCGGPTFHGPGVKMIHPENRRRLKKLAMLNDCENSDLRGIRKVQTVSSNLSSILALDDVTFEVSPLSVTSITNGSHSEATSEQSQEKNASSNVRLKTNKEIPGLVHQSRANMHISESQQEFFRMLDEKIEKGRDYCSEEEDIT
ncbi:PREDICTED: uncharacterized protein C1orf21 homolog isoform X2 [Chinchilla lanigera]|uniref:uncharacterized protein C1orf21 homolog isoform X2 n=1 Tax=Chinchilla lanigera TaxID=34839 RepID=UPI000697D9A0|nr:PREDICTED: uncharacterized protein C1orf21 homolog isoform X2 [Chinchilla lanigera]